MKYPIDGHPELFKDADTGVILNKSDSDRERYRIAKQQSKVSLDTQSELANLRGEIDEIKHLLHQLINK
jgi:hypothetical protein